MKKLKNSIFTPGGQENSPQRLTAGDKHPDYDRNLSHAETYSVTMMNRELDHIHVHVPINSGTGGRMIYLCFIPPIDAKKTDKLVIPVSFLQSHENYLSDLEQAMDLVHKYSLNFLKKHFGVVFEFPLFPAKACAAANKAYSAKLNDSDRQSVQKILDTIKPPKEEV